MGRGAAARSEGKGRTLPASAVDFVGVRGLPEIEAWLAGARAGEWIVYAHLDRLPPRTPGAVALYAQERAGVVTLFQSKTDDGLRDYVAKRTDKPMTAAAPAAPEPCDEDRRVLALLKRYARDGMPCPTNREIARRAMLTGPEQASYRLRRLRDLGEIALSPVPVEPGRIVTIVATGQKTGRFDCVSTEIGAAQDDRRRG